MIAAPTPWALARIVFRQRLDLGGVDLCLRGSFAAVVLSQTREKPLNESKKLDIADHTGPQTRLTL